MRTLIASTACFVLLAGVPVFAAGEKGSKGLRAMDTDKDGRISMSEFQTARPKKKAEGRFKKMDANNDGFLSTDELSAARDARKGSK